MKPTFYLPLCAVAIACSLAVWAFARWMEEPNNLSGGSVEAAHASEALAAKAERSATRPEQVASGGRVPPAAQSINPEAQRIIAELVETGMTQEEAALAYRRVTEAARIERSTRPPMPGVRTNIDTNRFPLFEEP